MNRIKGLVKQTNSGVKMVEPSVYKERWDKLARNITALSPRAETLLSARSETQGGRLRKDSYKCSSRVFMHK